MRRDVTFVERREMKNNKGPLIVVATLWVIASLWCFLFPYLLGAIYFVVRWWHLPPHAR